MFMYVRNSVPSLCAASAPSAVAPSLRADLLQFDSERRLFNSITYILSSNHRMKTRFIILPLLCICTTLAAQDHIRHDHADDSTDVFFRHLQLNELTVTGVTGDTKLREHRITPGTQGYGFDKYHRCHRPSARSEPADHRRQYLETHHSRTGL